MPEESQPAKNKPAKKARAAQPPAPKPPEGGFLSTRTWVVLGVVLGVAQLIGAQINTSDEVLAGYIVFLAVLLIRPQGLTARRAR